MVQPLSRFLRSVIWALKRVIRLLTQRTSCFKTRLPEIVSSNVSLIAAAQDPAAFDHTESLSPYERKDCFMNEVRKTACAQHEHRLTFFALLEQQWMYGRAYVLVRSRWPDMYCVYPHAIRTGRDWLKLVHCVLAVFYQPAILAHRMNTWGETIRAYPLLLLHHATWKLGMVRQCAFGGARSNVDQCASPSVYHRRQWSR